MPQKRKELRIGGANLWYLVGLITSDGCLCPDGRHIDITSKDYQLLSTIKAATGITNRIGIKYGYKKTRAFHIQMGNKYLYEFLLSIGLKQNKSLTLGEINIANEFFADFLRGLIDGDGSMRWWIHPSNKREQYSLRIYSGSKKFIDWLSSRIEQLFNVFGKVHQNATNTWVLKYGKMAAREIVKRCYYKDCLGLDRKIKLANECLASYRGWSKSKTVFN